MSQITLDPELIRLLDVSGPRYTSYPSADRFNEAFDEAAYRSVLAGRGLGGGMNRALSLYVHIPFCTNPCFYCGCNRVITRRAEDGARYIHSLAQEISLVGEALSGSRRVLQGHLGGGTPDFLTTEQLRTLMAVLERHFGLDARGDWSVECDPRTVTDDKLACLAELGFTRVSFGVQDFDPEVQQAINRVQGIGETYGAIASARAHGYTSVNLDLIYGLPHQTPARFAATLDRVIAADPERIALYRYAHLPTRFPGQRQIAEEALPSAAQSLEIFAGAVERLGAAGYVYIGMDHFAKPGSELAVAQREGRLARDFQGYSTGAGLDLIGLGMSAIGAVGASYSQNARRLDDYYALLDAGRLPIQRGLALSRDDLARRAVIQALMTQGELEFEAIEQAHLIRFSHYFSREMDELAWFETHDLVSRDDQRLTVTPRGRFVVRHIAMHFDRYLQQEQDHARYSRVL